MATRMQQRRGTAAQWTAANSTLAAGEIGFETDTNKFKIGNGSSNWAALSYFANTAGLEALLNDGAPAALNTLNEIAAAINDDPTFFTTVGTNLTNHQNDTTDIHGIANTANLETTSGAQTKADTAVGTHNSDTTDVHGIADTTLLATQTYANTAVSTHNSDTTDVHGIANTALLATQEYVTDAIGSVTDDYSTLAGTGIDWNADADRFDIDNTIATVANLSDHATDTTNIHGVADFTLLETTSGAQTKADTAVSTHNSDTTDVHGIANTANLETTSGAQTKADTAVSTHNSDTTDVHGIADTALLATKAYADTAEADAITAAGTAADSKIATAVAALTKSSVGLANVDNTSDANKPVSTATQTALDAKASLSGATFTGSVEIDQNLTVDGNLTVNGTTFNASSTSIVIEDNIVQLAHQNAANTVDLGLVVAYNDGSTKHAGIVRDVSDAKWKLFKDVATEPSTTVAFGEGSLDTLAVGALEATTVTPSSGVVFSDGTQTKEGVPSRTPIVQKTASYALSTLTHRDSMIEVDSTSATTLTIPLDSTVNYPVGTTIDILQTNTGQVTIAPVSGSVTVNATPGLKLRTRWSSATLMKRAANTWVVFGDLTA